MGIDEYNYELLRYRKPLLRPSSTINGSINYPLIASLQEYYQQCGYPSEEDYKRREEKIKQFTNNLKQKQMTVDYLKKYAFEKIKKYPDKQDMIYDFVNLAVDNIEEGESENNEVNLAIQSINDCVEFEKE